MEKIFDIKKHNTAIYTLANGITPQTFFTGSGDGTIGLWDITQKTVLPLSINTEGAVFSIFFDDQKEHLLIGKLNGDLHVIDLQSKEEIHFIKHHKKGIFQILPTPEHYITLGGDGQVGIWNRADYQLYRTLPISDQRLRAASFYQNNERIAISGTDGHLQILETSFWNTLYSGKVSETSITSLSIHPHKPVLLMGDNHGILHIYKYNDHSIEYFHKIPAHEGAIYNITFNAANNLFATSSRDKSIKIWDAQTLDIVAKADNKIVAHRHSVNALLWHHNNTLISGGDDARVIAWKI